MSTFEAHGHTWTSHTPGDPMPCTGKESIITLLREESGSSRPSAAQEWWWGADSSEKYLEIIGWRYATPQPQEPDELPARTPCTCISARMASLCRERCCIQSSTIDELTTLRAERELMLEAIRDAANSFTLINEHPSDFTSPEVFYWNARDQARAALAKLKQFLPSK